MKTSELSKQLAGSAELFFRKHGPVILTTAGVAGFLVTNYLTGKAVLKSREKVEKLRFRTEELKTEPITKTFTRKDQTRGIGELWIHEGLSIAKDFGPAMAVGSVSIFCIVSSHGMMRNKQASLAAAYSALDQGFRAYRERVKAEIGDERELDLYRKPALIRGETDENGITMCEIDQAGLPPAASMYGKFFDESSTSWSKNPEYNLMFLRAQEKYANDRLQGYGFVFLNEVYEWLGLQRTQAGQTVGWRKDAARRGTGDGFIDFGIYDIYDESSRAFVNGYEASIFLDFNVDGPITI
jgi:Family of unknown function (DUF6353)